MRVGGGATAIRCGLGAVLIALICACATRASPGPILATPALPVPNAGLTSLPLPAASGGELRFGVTADYPPFALPAANGRLTGADVESARRVATTLDVRAQFVPTTWSTLAEDFTAGRFDVLIGGITVTPERAALGTYSIILMNDGKRPLARCAERDRYATVDGIDRPDVRVMVMRAPGVPELARQLFPRAIVTTNQDNPSPIPQLLSGKVDLWLTDGVVAEHMARRHAGQLCVAVAGPFMPIAKAWLIRRDPTLVAAINRALGVELRSGSWRRDLEAVP